jgi:rRNA-processing protein FCF1
VCIVVDTSTAGDYVNKKEYLAPVGNFILKGGKIVISRCLFEEYPASFRNLVVELKRVGKVVQCDDEDLPPEIAAKMESDDPHVVSLVRKSRSRVVCTRDDNLIKDLKNKAIVDSPRCSVYRHEGARRVLSGCCP